MASHALAIFAIIFLLAWINFQAAVRRLQSPASGWGLSPVTCHLSPNFGVFSSFHNPARNVFPRAGLFFYFGF